MTRVLAKNKFLFAALVSLLVLFAVVLFYGAKRIHNEEARWRHGNTRTILDYNRRIIKNFFQSVRDDLALLSDLATYPRPIKGYFHDLSLRRRIIKSFLGLHNQYNDIWIVDRSGKEMMLYDAATNGDYIPIQMRSPEHKDRLYKEVLRLGAGELYVSSLPPGENDMSPQPVKIIGVPLFDSAGGRSGALLLSLNLAELFTLIHRNVFIYTPEGILMQSTSDGSPVLERIRYPFSGTSGELELSEEETIHYTTLEYLPGRDFVVGIFHRHPELKEGLEALILLVLLILGVFIVLLSIVASVNINRVRQLLEAQKAIMYSLARLAEWRDEETGHHMQRTTTYTVTLAKELQKKKGFRKTVTREFVENLKDAAPLHDMGKVGIRDEILLKKSNLTDEEFKEMQKHVLIGKQIIEDVINTFRLKESFFMVARNICAYHQEKFNGSGYMEGLKGSDIPLEARIFSVCDVYDALTSRRPYKEPLTHEEAVAAISSESNEHFDPEIVEAFLQCEKRFREIRWVTDTDHRSLDASSVSSNTSLYDRRP
jgi:putative two-component system response regulator